ncbi:MAG: ATP-dependent helicase [Acholeplasmatales bacterium]|jgi:DNA helicase-2/ATP-dependent DNA helicase PcrA|nr:ATP-dependent helicase [Acholeplasmatales bacterium]
MGDYLDSLNDKQLEAVKCINGPVEVIAGAGTGKTKTLTSRIIYLIEQKYAAVSQILAVTFTNKAATEMKLRVANQLSDLPMNFLNIMTFHSFGLKVLRRYGDLLTLGKLDSHALIIDEEDQKKIINDLKKELEIKNTKVHDILNYISLKKFAECLKNNTFEIDVKIEKIYQLYKTYLEEQNLVDFDDLLIYTYVLFEQQPQVLATYRQEFKYILVDEFQDTSLLQYLILKQMALLHRNLFIVGDPDQAIYAFRGASYDNEQLMKKDFQPILIVLDKNYRSTNTILKHANSLIKENTNRVAKNLVSDNNQIIEVIHKNFRNEHLEATYIANEIRKLITNYQVSPNEIAILYRANHLSRIYEEALIKERIDYKIFSGHSFFEREEVKDIIAYLRLIVNPDLDFAFKRIVNKPLRGIGFKSVERLEELAQSQNISMYEAIDNYNNFRLSDFKEEMENLQARVNICGSLGEFYNELLEKLEFKKYLEEYKDSPEERLEHVKELKSVISYHESVNHDFTNMENLQEILDIFSLESSVEESKTKKKEDCVVLSSYHRVKGLEFNTVFLVALEEGIFPGRNYDDIEEERRIAYVGVTRTKERLYLTNAHQRYLFGELSGSGESQFVKEMYKNLTSPKVVPLKDKSIPFVGMKKHHKEYGEGIVIKFDEHSITVAFKLPFGIKKFMRTKD